jgi:hypothetical protein
MHRVEEIETAITNLPPDDYRRLVDWSRAREQTLWDDQIDHDSVARRLDFLFNEVQSESNRKHLAHVDLHVLRS